MVTSRDAATGAIVASNPWVTEYASRVAFAWCSEPVRSMTGDRTEFLGRNGSLSAPAGLAVDALSNRLGAGLDPCAALHSSILLAPGETRRVVFLLGEGTSVDDVHALIGRCGDVQRVQEGRRRSDALWEDILGAVQVRTPDDSFDLMVNRWLLYQTVTARLWARTGFYQPGGAFGFRDQLQDVMALGFSRTDLYRQQVLLAASRQFVEGDVQHWWHPPTGRGTRTRCSDDLLWLPYVVSQYLKATGDASVLDEMVPFLEAPPLTPDQHEVYDLPMVSAVVGVAVRSLRARDRSRAHVRRPRAATDGHRRLERRHEPGRSRRPRRERLARLVPLRRPHGVRSAGQRTRARRSRHPLRGRGTTPGQRARTVVGWPVVSPRVLRRRHAAGIGGQR